MSSSARFTHSNSYFTLCDGHLLLSYTWLVSRYDTGCQPRQKLLYCQSEEESWVNQFKLVLPVNSIALHTHTHTHTHTHVLFPCPRSLNHHHLSCALSTCHVNQPQLLARWQPAEKKPLNIMTNVTLPFFSTMNNSARLIVLKLKNPNKHGFIKLCLKGSNFKRLH